MTFTPGNEPNRATSFDFGLGSPAADDSEQPTRRSARVARVDSRSLAVPLIVTLASLALVGGAAYAGYTVVNNSELEVKADSAQFCARLAETPGVLNQPGFGWTTPDNYLDAMTDYQARWAAIAAVAPPTIKPDVQRVADAATVLIDGVVASKTIDRPATLTKMDSVTSKTAIPAWAAKYCD